jgi:hypothetical protein
MSYADNRQWVNDAAAENRWLDGVDPHWLKWLLELKDALERQRDEAREVANSLWWRLGNDEALGFDPLNRYPWLTKP